MICYSFPGPSTREAGFCGDSLCVCVRAPWESQVAGFSGLGHRRQKEKGGNPPPCHSTGPKILTQSFFSPSESMFVFSVKSKQPYAAGRRGRNASTMPSCLEPEPPTRSPAVHDRNSQQATRKIKLPPPDKKHLQNPTAVIIPSGGRLSAPCLQLGKSEAVCSPHFSSPLHGGSD